MFTYIWVDSCHLANRATEIMVRHIPWGLNKEDWPLEEVRRPSVHLYCLRSEHHAPDSALLCPGVNWLSSALKQLFTRTLTIEDLSVARKRWWEQIRMRAREKKHSNFTPAFHSLSRITLPFILEQEHISSQMLFDYAHLNVQYFVSFVLGFTTLKKYCIFWPTLCNFGHSFAIGDHFDNFIVGQNWQSLFSVTCSSAAN